MPYKAPAQRNPGDTWDEVITAGNSLTKKEVHDYYSNPVITQRLLATLANKDILTVQSRNPEHHIVRRYQKKDTPYRINTPEELSYLTSRRHTEFHPTIGTKTKDLWVDIDPGNRISTEDLKPTVLEVVKNLKKFPGVRDVNLTFSGGKGFHVRGVLNTEKDPGSLRAQLAAKLEAVQRDNPHVTMQRPARDQIHLDLSTLHRKGALRAPYSINAETGLVAVPLTLNQLIKFKPERDATPKAVLRRTEYAPGIPSERKTHALPTFETPKTWTLAVQQHNAKRAGKHWDVRLVDPKTTHAHSFAVPKSKFPEGNTPLLAIRTPTHTARYALTFGEGKPQTIGKGYGTGTVEIRHKEPISVLSSEPNKIKFERTVDGKKERYLLFKTKKDAWLMRKTAHSIYLEGKQAMLRKLGAADKYVQTPASNTEAEQPLESIDEGLPAGQLAQALTKLPTPVSPSESQQDSTEDIEARMNKQTMWSSPEGISLQQATGPSPVSQGAF